MHTSVRYPCTIHTNKLYFSSGQKENFHEQYNIAHSPTHYTHCAFVPCLFLFLFTFVSSDKSLRKCTESLASAKWGGQINSSYSYSLCISLSVMFCNCVSENFSTVEETVGKVSYALLSNDAFGIFNFDRIWHTKVRERISEVCLWRMEYEVFVNVSCEFYEFLDSFDKVYEH